MKLFFVLTFALISSVTTTKAHAAAWIKALTHEQFVKLPRSLQYQYITVLQDISRDFELRHPRDAAKGDARKEARLMDVLLGEAAFAATEDCLFAGHFMTWNANNRCPAPPRGNCVAGQIQCHWIYGENCTQPNNNATATCIDASKDQLQRIAEWIKQHKSEFDAYAGRLNTYCAAEGSQRQRDTCALTQTRIRTFAEANGWTTPETPTAQPAAAQRANTQRAAERPSSAPDVFPREITGQEAARGTGAAGGGGAGGGRGQFGPGEVPGIGTVAGGTGGTCGSRGGAAPNTAGSECQGADCASEATHGARHVPHDKRTCNTLALMGTISIPNEFVGGKCQASMTASKILMDLAQARSLACSGQVDRALIDRKLTDLDARLKCAQTRRTQLAARYVQQYQYQKDNLMACSQNPPQSPPSPQIIGTVTHTGIYGVTIVNHQQNCTIDVHVAETGAAMAYAGLDVCQTQVGAGANRSREALEKAQNTTVR